MHARRSTWRTALAGTLVVAGLATGGAAAVAAEPPAADTAQHRDDRKLIEDQFRQMETGWWNERGPEFAAAFTEDADLVTFNGDYLRTRPVIAERMQYYFDTYIEKSHIKRLDEHLRFVEPDLAIVVRTTCLVPAGQTGCRAGSDSRNTNVLLKRHGKWLQTSFQNTRIDPLP
ncbi:SgcJ/EcaC family oxidoreductase [Amycolatopsis anabasis]|uniref:SgcJ/EcaC family oxidoreductase n=1 Tax=Amycolatopsis anabasis TaxID=1840409 RepID=UPI00131AAEF9|nr:SgcJ/EcaC family oxidoreductase [Amycolatopsis anabasis]